MRLRRVLLSLSVLLAPALVAAHGELLPLRGGVVAWSRELSVELVAVSDDALHVYVDDHGTPVSIEGTKGHVNIVRGDEQLDAIPLVPDGSTKLVGTKTYRPGDRIQVIVTFTDGRLVVARLLAPNTAAATPTTPLSFAPRFVHPAASAASATGQQQPP